MKAKKPYQCKSWKRATDEEIMKAAVKPRRCSEARWRIELRRRANAERYEAAPDERDII